MIREAEANDVHAIGSLLRQHDLRTEGVLETGTRYWVAEKGLRVVGAIGLELGDTSVLLRSAIVDPRWRGGGLGRELTGAALGWARAAGYRLAYCFSTDAGTYWVARGFRSCSVDEVVHALPNAPQVELFARLGWLPTEEAFQIGLR
jgi:N-acetylglutamate synthase-like GNAT family acetyltransferase